jgi:hypothetical protein
MFGRKRKLDDFTSEIDAHLQLEMERLREQGLSADEARAGAHRAFGNVTLSRERSYESRRWLWWDHFWHDIRYGLRALLRERGVSALCVLILTLGIGASTALYSVWKSALVFPYAFESNGRWVAVLAGFNRQQTRSWFFSAPEYDGIRKDSRWCVPDCEESHKRLDLDSAAGTTVRRWNFAILECRILLRTTPDEARQLV